MGLTGHFIHESELISINFGVSHLTEPHNSDYLCQILITMTEKWGITPEKVAAVVTDNGANILLNTVKDITTYCKQNVNISDALRKAQNEIAVPLKLIQSVCTRWNSIYYQLVRFVKLSELRVLAPILLNYPKAPPMLTASQLDGIKDLINILKPMEAVTKEVSVEKFYNVDGNRCRCCTKNLILEELKKRFGTVEQVHVLAITTLLDPRFKKIHFSDRIACSRAIDKINSMIVASKKPLQNKLSNEDSENNLECQLKDAEESNIWEFHNILVKNQLQLFQAETEGQGLQDELKHYLTQPVVDFKTTAPITYWYYQRNSLYSSITPIANKYFCIVETSRPPYHVWAYLTKFDKIAVRELKSKFKKSAPENENILGGCNFKEAVKIATTSNDESPNFDLHATEIQEIGDSSLSLYNIAQIEGSLRSSTVNKLSKNNRISNDAVTSEGANTLDIAEKNPEN
nr:unnamed protein product [Callosobruchus chinensis]